MGGVASHPVARHLVRAKDLADARFAEPLTVADLAAAAGLSPAHFSREFRRAFGESPHAYLLTRRLERAASMLRMTLPAVNSALGRARTRLARTRRASAEVEAASLDAGQQRLLERYVKAWESGDVKALVALLSRDASFSMPPVPTWFRGRRGISSALTGHVFAAAERLLVAKALELARHNQVHAARLLGISRNVLRDRMKRYELS